MALVQTILNRSLRLLGVLDPNESAPAEDSNTAIEALNAMMVRWEADGISVGWSAVAAGSDTLPAPPEAEKAIAYNLAVELRPEYRVTLDQDVYAQAAESKGKVLGDVMAVDYARTEYDLPSSENSNISGYRGFYRGF